LDVGLLLDRHSLLRTPATIDQHVMDRSSIDILSIRAAGGLLVGLRVDRRNVGRAIAGADAGPRDPNSRWSARA